MASSGWHFYLIFGNLQVQILAQRHAVLIVAFCGLPQTIQESTGLYLTSGHDYIPKHSSELINLHTVTDCIVSATDSIIQ